MFRVEFQTEDGSWRADYRRFDTWRGANVRCQSYTQSGYSARVIKLGNDQ